MPILNVGDNLVPPIWVAFLAANDNLQGLGLRWIDEVTDFCVGSFIQVIGFQHRCWEEFGQWR